MMVSGNLKPVAFWLRDTQSVEISAYHAAGGGCINETGILHLSDGTRLFLKQQQGAPADFFNAEAFGLDALRTGTTLRIPQVVHVDREFLLLEDLGNNSPARDFWQRLGAGLAQLHSQSFATFGLEMDGYCGRTPQRNSPMTDGFEFFATHRLNALAEQAHSVGLLDRADHQAVARLADNLKEYIPPQPAVLIHGDLWSGNVHCDNEGHPALIDPACYRGWAEADLAMTTLFGGFDRKFYQAYEEASGIDRDWRSRAPIYNLYHLLNHLILFGTGYLGQVRSILENF